MGPDNLCVHSFNKYSPSVLHPGPTTSHRIYSDKQNRLNSHPQGVPRIVLDILSYLLARSINLFHR